MRVGLLSDDFVIAGWASQLDLVHFGTTGFVRPGVPRLLVAASEAARRLRGRGSCGERRPAWRECGARFPGCLAIRCAARGSRCRRRDVRRVSRPERSGRLGVGSPGRADDDARAHVGGAGDRRTAACRAAALASAAALLVKETAIVVPVLSALVILARGGLPGVRRYRSALLSLAAISLIYLLARVAAGVPSSFLEITDWRYFIKQLIANAFGTVGAPWTDDWGRTHAGLALMRAVSILALAAAAFYRWRRDDATFRASGCLRGLGARGSPACLLALLRRSAARRRALRLSACRRFHDPARAARRTRGQSRRRSGAAGRDRPDDGAAGRAVPPGDRERSPTVGSGGGRAPGHPRRSRRSSRARRVHDVRR